LNKKEILYFSEAFHLVSYWYWR